MANRLDLLSEFDFIWQRKFGFRVSGAGWYDEAYSNLHNGEATENTLSNGLPTLGLSSFTNRYAKGVSGELDGFVFGNFDLGDVPVKR